MLTRRTLLASPWGLAGVRAATRLTPDEFKRQLRGPICSAPTCFTENYAVDHLAMRRQVDLAARAGVRVFTLTKGNNQYDSLTYDEVKALTKTMVEAVAGRGILIAATGDWWTGQAADYARFAEELGASAVQILPPAGISAAAWAEHFRQVARSTRLPLVLHGQPPLEAYAGLAAIPSLAAIKEEFTVDYTTSIYQQFGERWNLFAGGTKARFLSYRAYGMQAYYSAFSTFAPQVAMRFWQAVERSDLKEAQAIVWRYDIPFFRRWSHAFWRATLEVFGVARRFQRPPAPVFTNGQVEEVRQFFRELELLPAA
jgi:4-hydroxy-tetrahydrodipicolinate synthase